MKPLLIAHRGASGLAPENTLSAFRLAVDIGVDAIETDIRLTADGIPVCFHDARLDRLTNLTGELRSVTYNELSKADSGGWFNDEFKGEKAPLLEEYLEVCLGNAMPVIEIKEPSAIEAIARVIKDKFSSLTKYAVMSSHKEAVSDYKLAEPKALRGWIVKEYMPVDELKQIAINLNADFLAIKYSIIDEKMICELKQNNIIFWVWTVDEPNSQNKLVENCVNGIVTNYPDRLKLIINESK